MSKEVVINFDKLEKEVHNAMRAEEKYSRENQAKFRAIEQRAATYEDFRQIVLASNLKPLDKGETLRTVTLKTTWNQAAAASGKPEDGENVKSGHLDVGSNLAEVVPKSNLEFMQLWRKISSADRRWEFIENIGTDRLIELCKTEINGELLGQFLTLFHARLTTREQEKSDTDLILSLLNGFPKCGRFELNFLFLQKSEIETCKKLFAILEEMKQRDDGADLSSLKKLYFK